MLSQRSPSDFDNTLFEVMNTRKNFYHQLWLETILNSVSDGVFTMDREWKITFFNHAAEKITGVSRQEALGMRCSKIFCSNICGKNCPMHKTFATKLPMLNKETHILNHQGTQIPIALSSLLLRNERNEIIGGAETFQDLRMRKKNADLQEKIHGKLELNESTSIEKAVKAVEAQTIISALKRNNYNRKATADYLGIHKSTFFRKIKHLGIVLPQHDGRSRLSNNERNTTNS
ncbi:MAG: PAS domain S-box protein [Desulfobulbaceae bacterium]|nr:PAS domain S-box protein [Desulfobulbaceae bacterium]